MTRIFRIVVATLLVGMVAGMSASAADRTRAAIDRSYETAKQVEIETLRLQLATHPDAEASLGLVEAEDGLRRLHAARTRAQRERIAIELEAVLNRIHLQADLAGR
ncbi:MAG: hypothetical protein HY985_04930 [Magnetospirillum sp.]|nr:hypothetical protein [Magnetospirillum sp.]